MALRSRSRTASATSGPGRAPASDGRLAHRRAPGSRTHARHRSHARHGRRHAAPEELRRRAETLFAERAEGYDHAGHEGAHGETGKGPPLPGLDAPARQGSPLPGLDAPTGPGTAWRERAGSALRERMPLWLQTRCGLERRSVAALSVLLVVAAVFAVQHFWTGRTHPVAAPEVVREAAAYGAGKPEPTAEDRDTAGGSGPKAAATATAGPEIVVDVGGKVRDPGVHSLPAGSRVADALRAAGGVRPGTKTDGLNRARFLVDGEQVIVGAPAPAPRPGAGPAPDGPTGAAGPAAPVSLSTATTDQLDTLPGVGPVLAQHIIDYRTQHGGFRSVDELREVNGIGERRFADLRDLVRP
ncbi:ComEA family DNA-binding protein [Streptomyces sp. RK76]|uniref:ComEA family DNA-binding protein n=1 Tax=Streptomyces sp. RK76 TaxID=2824896 RepID=UPI001B37DA80|nr:ComEA family DNA-binding protein [Streptomyces sp. RK76]MBQ0947808.1 ComEA family DNA-binding protein [Streptomyces sp. RK76]